MPLIHLTNRVTASRGNGDGCPDRRGHYTSVICTIPEEKPAPQSLCTRHAKPLSAPPRSGLAAALEFPSHPALVGDEHTAPRKGSDVASQRQHTCLQHTKGLQIKKGTCTIIKTKKHEHRFKRSQTPLDVRRAPTGHT